jgi:hypothetical protein
MMEKRGVEVGYSKYIPLGKKFMPQLEPFFLKGKKRPMGKSWRMNETYLKVIRRLEISLSCLLTRTARPSTSAHHPLRQEGRLALF